MSKLYCIGTKNGKIITATTKEIINNALQQESEGIAPSYKFRYKDGDYSPAGWLVWSSFHYGVGVVYRRKDGKMIIITGLQGDFVTGYFNS